jgi:uncharacterized DUF497 family protein
MSLQFEWDKRKAITNLRKHDVSFDEATTVFDDPLAAIFDDEDHSAEEAREIIIGHSVLRRLLVVCYTEHREEVIRIFSARVATKREQTDYEEYIQDQAS